MMALMEIARRGVHCYFIAHMKPLTTRQGMKLQEPSPPTGLRATPRHGFSKSLRFALSESVMKGALTGASHSVATLTDNRQSLHVPPSVVLFEKNSDGGVWHGWKGLRDGSFEHPDDVLWNS